MQNSRRFSREGWRSISASVVAGTFFSFPVSWAACASARGILAEPIANAFLGIVSSFIVYTLAFATITKRPLRTVVFGLAARLSFELTARGLLQAGFMFAGFHAGWASLLAQLISGLGSHLSIPYFIKRTPS